MFRGARGAGESGKWICGAGGAIELDSSYPLLDGILVCFTLMKIIQNFLLGTNAILIEIYPIWGKKHSFFSA